MDINDMMICRSLLIVVVFSKCGHLMWLDLGSAMCCPPVVCVCVMVCKPH